MNRPISFVRAMAKRVSLRTLLLAGVLCSGVHATLHAQTSAPTPASKASPQLPARLLPATRAAIEHLADSLRTAGVPAEPIYDKAAEGVLKDADDARILAATRTLARELGTASSLLGANAQLSDVVSAASALRAGVPVRAVKKLVGRRTKNSDADGRLALSFIILVDFASRGVPVDAAVTAVDGLLAKGAGGSELTTFRNGVERDLQAGRDIGKTLTTRAEGAMRRR